MTAVAAPRRLQFDVPGIPQPQGSTRSFARGGRTITTSDNPKLRPWRDAVCWHAREAMGGTPAFTGSVMASAIFWMPRPAGHFGTGRNAGRLKPTAATYPTVKPDLDKLVRAVLDALSEAGVWRDDAQVVSFGIVRKQYADKPGVSVLVEALQ